MKELPKHIAMILDGNRRWAKERGLHTLKGHMQGAENIKEIAKFLFEKGVEYLSIFAFSTENFNRSEEEVNYLMNLFVSECKKIAKELNKYDAKIVFSGGIHPLPDAVLKEMASITELTKDNKKATLNICLNYGGRSEIVDTTKKIAQKVLDGELEVDEIDTKLFDDNLYNKLPDIDLMIRTSGECRISNFMLWKLSYAEMFFTKTYFPAFTTMELDEILDEYMGRERRFGGNK